MNRAKKYLFFLVSMLFIISAGGCAVSVTTTKVSDNAAIDWDTQISGDYVVWYGDEDGDYEIYLYQISNRNTTQISQNAEWDINPQVNGDYVVWEGKADGDTEVITQPFFCNFIQYPSKAWMNA